MRCTHGTMALAAAMVLMAGGVAPVDAQTDLRVRATVGWDSGRIGVEYGTRDVRPYYGERYDVRHPRRGPRYEERVRRLRIPRGHRPGAGMCRAWFPGTPPGLQPPARPCGVFHRYGVPYGAVLIGPGGRPVLVDGRGGPHADTGPSAHAGPRGEWHGKKGKKGKGRRPPRGRGHGPRY